MATLKRWAFVPATVLLVLFLAGAVVDSYGGSAPVFYLVSAAASVSLCWLIDRRRRARWGQLR
jgi:hypothetical protein